jgi:ATP-dependent Clp protease, protease subunit
MSSTGGSRIVDVGEDDRGETASHRLRRTVTGAVDHLFDRRVLLVGGVLDDAATSELAARLMTLDALGDEPIELRLGTCEGSFESALVVLDILDVVGVEVRTVGFGTIQAGPVGILASGARRALARHARLQTGELEVEVSGTASDLERTLAAHAVARDQFLERVARGTGRATAEVAAEWARRCVLDAVDARSLGYVDEVLGS